jgi:hypothetical protein
LTLTTRPSLLAATLTLELLADQATEALPRREYGSPTTEPYPHDGAEDGNPRHPPLDLLAVEVALFLVLDIAVLAHNRL